MPDQDQDARRPHIPKPPTPAEVDQISREQGMISDEWADDAPDGEKPSRPAKR